MAEQHEVDAPKQTGEDAWEFFYERKVPEVPLCLLSHHFPIISIIIYHWNLKRENPKLLKTKNRNLEILLRPAFPSTSSSRLFFWGQCLNYLYSILRAKSMTLWRRGKALVECWMTFIPLFCSLSTSLPFLLFLQDYLPVYFLLYFFRWMF